MRGAGAGWVRINFRLGACYRDWTSIGCNGRTALDAYDDIVAAAEREGLQVLGLIANESWPGDPAQWVENNAETTAGNGDNDYLRAFSLAAAVPLVQHFRGRITTWEVWNEPNAYTTQTGAGHYGGGTFIYPSNLAWLLRHVYEDTRRAGGPGARFISGGLLSHDDSGVPVELAAALAHGILKPRPLLALGSGEQPDNRPDGLDLTFDPSGALYLQATYRYGRALAGWDQIEARYGSYPLDGIGQHLYIDQGSATSRERISANLQSVRAAYEAFEGRQTAKQIYITEFGWQTSAVTHRLQAANLQIACDTFGSLPYVAQAYWTGIQDVAAASLYFGLVDADGSLKPAYRAYQLAATETAAR